MKILGLVVGVVFGFVLAWTRVTDYDAMRDMLQFRDLYLFQMMMTAIAVAAAGAWALKLAGVRTLAGGQPVVWTRSTPTRDTIVGSLVFGIGWAVSGACVGPTAAQIGQGRLGGLFSAAGILAGVALRQWQLRRADQAASVVPAPTIGM